MRESCGLTSMKHVMRLVLKKQSKHIMQKGEEMTI